MNERSFVNKLLIKKFIYFKYIFSLNKKSRQILVLIQKVFRIPMKIIWGLLGPFLSSWAIVICLLYTNTTRSKSIRSLKIHKNILKPLSQTHIQHIDIKNIKRPMKFSLGLWNSHLLLPTPCHLSNSYHLGTSLQ